MSELTYCVVDVELDGPTPGENSMLSLACSACGEDGAEIDTFERNLEPLPGAAPTPEIAAWWQSQAEAWQHITADPKAPELVVSDFVDWLAELPGACVLAAHPLLLDGAWIDWYLRRFADLRVFEGPFPGSSPFAGAGIDIPSFVQAALGLPYFETQPDYPPEFLGGIAHTHKPLDDARGHAALYFFARQRLRELWAG